MRKEIKVKKIFYKLNKVQYETNVKVSVLFDWNFVCNRFSDGVLVVELLNYVLIAIIQS